MERGTFMDIVSIHYKDIKNTFICRSVKSKGVFDEDSFNDAFIKCAEHFGESVINFDDAIKYFWVSYVNTKISNYKNSSKYSQYEELSEDIIDDTDEGGTKYFYDRVMDAISEVFGENDMMVYSLYMYHNWSKEELEQDGYICNNLDAKIKLIHKFVKQYTKKKK
jgi:hypothetical protein